MPTKFHLATNYLYLSHVQNKSGSPTTLKTPKLFMELGSNSKAKIWSLKYGPGMGDALQCDSSSLVLEFSFS